MRGFGIGLLAGVLLFLAISGETIHAATLSVSPLKYDAELKAGEKKKGFVDISNPSAEGLVVKLTVQAFRQIDDQGTLQFYDSDAISDGVKLDYSEVEIGPRETLHLAFLLDGNKLPEGDVFAAIFAGAEPSRLGAAEQTVKVGTLLIITNGTPANHIAVVEQLSVPWLQIGGEFSAHFALRNTANQSEGTGFAPEVTVSAWPFIHDVVTGPLVFSGRTRQVDYVKSGSFMGLVRVGVKTGQSEQAAYTFLITGYWKWLFPLLLVLVAGGGMLVWTLYRRRRPARL